jgi:hypothetical protein
MADSQTAIETKRLRDRGKRLWANYRWTNDMYDALFAAQNGRCAACGREPLNKPLNLDHYHFKIHAFRTGAPNPKDKWRAVTTFPDGREYHGLGATKVIAAAAVRSKALPASVRGLLCPGRYTGCNRLLGRIDDIQLLKAFIHYLENPPAKQIVLDNPPKV